MTDRPPHPVSNRLRPGLFFLCLLLWGATGPATVQGQDFPEQVKQPVEKSIEVRRTSQEESDRWAEERRTLAAEYDRRVAERDALIAQRDRLQRQVDAQRAAVQSLQQQLDESERMTAEIPPFLEETFQRLSERVQAALPFLPDERRRRLQRLREILDDARVPDAEKFRKTMEALMVEAEYGNTVEVYRQPIERNGREVLTDVFRLGRISLFFQTLDGAEAGYFNPASDTWEVLDAAYRPAVAAAMEMGARRRSVQLLNLPIGRLAVP